MKSSIDELRKRGKFDKSYIDKMQNQPYEELLSMIDQNIATQRSAAVHVLA